MKALDKVALWGFEYDVEFARYQGTNNIAMLLTRFDEDEGKTTMFATVNTFALEDDFVAIKDYSENTGILDVLIKAGYVKKPKRFIEFEFVTIDVCELTKRAKKLRDEQL